MYGWLWRHLPGPWFLRLLLVLMIIAVVCYALFTVVYPWLSPYMPFNQQTVGE